MNLSNLKDADVLIQIKTLVEKERHLLTEILHHLRAVEHRKLFCDLGYQSLFDYAVKELKYSEGQAGRRIQAMRLLKELPAVEAKIQSGALNLMHLCQTQSYFREKAKVGLQSGGTASKPFSAKQLAEEKLQLLDRLENTSTREGEKLILSLNPTALPAERERIISYEHTEVRFVMNEELKKSLEEVRSLLGPKALNMNFSQLLQEMTSLSVAALKAKKFGKRRAAEMVEESGEGVCSDATPALESERSSSSKLISDLPSTSKAPQSVSKKLKAQVWQRDRGQCRACGSRHNLNFDHVKPRGLGGAHSIENLRLLCFNCNQRRGIKTFGLAPMKR
jgi:5-methylcytosine-specific restriction endonuclease McrA